MGNGSGRLVDSLAESLVNVLGESKDLNLMNNEKFSELTDLLHDLSTKIDESKKQNDDKIESETQLLYDALLTVLSDISGRVYRVDDLKKYKDKDIHKDSRKETTENTEKKKLSPDKNAKEKDKDKKAEEKDKKAKDDTIIDLLKKNPDTISKLLKGLESRQIERSVKMERSIKKSVKSRVGKLWSMFKKLLVVGLLLFFAPVLKSAFSKMADVLKSSFQKFKDLTEPLWRPFIEWFQSEFPMLTDYIKEMAGYVKKIGGAIKLIADGINSLIEWKEEHSTLTKGIEGALVGASMGAVAGSIIPGLGNLAGAILGGLLGFGVGAGKSLLKEKYKEENAAKIAEEEKQAKGASQMLAYYNTEDGKAALRGNAEKSVDADISHGWISRENRDAAIEEDIKWRIDSERWTADGKVGNEPKRSDYMQKFGYLENLSNPLSVEDVDLEGANHTSTDTAVEDGGASGGSGVAMQNIESHNQVTIIQNLHQANEGLDNR